MDENIFRAIAARHKAKALDAVEPFYDNNLKTGLRHHLDVGAGHCLFGGMNSG